MDNPAFSYGGAMPDSQDSSKRSDGLFTVDLPEKERPMMVLLKTIPAMGDRPELRFIVGLDSTPFRKTRTTSPRY